MEIVWRILQQVWLLTEAMAPWLLIGFGAAGVCAYFLPESLIERHLAKPGAGSVLKSVLIGMPLPLCSCGVIPVAAGLRKMGASKGAVAAFTASTPQTGIDSIAATYSLMGGIFTLIRVITDIVSGIAAGLAITLHESRTPPKPETADPVLSNECKSGSRCGPSEEDAHPDPRRHWLPTVLKEGFINLPREIGRAVIVGILLGGAISAFIPADLLGMTGSNRLVTYLVVTLAAVPLYVCATGSIPFAFGLIHAGLPPGAVVIFLVVGPATNTATLAAMVKLVGKTETVLYATVLVVCAWIAGYVADQIEGLEIAGLGSASDAGTTGWITTASAITVTLVLLAAVLPRRRKTRD
ncbi:MAG: hypothetical protein DRP71_12165 [Verrucomicrobia bacterium]|nr:MAG: hypothetical protein DRP71_12165 [Verrucomicrobiota bacterium]